MVSIQILRLLGVISKHQNVKITLQLFTISSNRSRHTNTYIQSRRTLSWKFFGAKFGKSCHGVCQTPLGVSVSINIFARINKLILIYNNLTTHGTTFTWHCTIPDYFFSDFVAFFFTWQKSETKKGTVNGEKCLVIRTSLKLGALSHYGLRHIDSVMGQILSLYFYRQTLDEKFNLFHSMRHRIKFIVT